jgi:hypothetical protein
MARNKPIEFTFVAETAAYLRDVKGMAVTTEDLEDAFVAVTQSSEDMERKLSRAVKDAASDVEVLERAIKDLPDATEKFADQARKDFDRAGDEAKNAADDAADAGKDFGQDFAGNLGEGLASGDISGTLSDTLGEAIGKISGPGSAVLAGMGALALAAWNVFKASSEKEKQGIADILDITDEVTGAIDQVELLRKGVTELGGGDFSQGMRDLSEYSRTLGINMDSLADLISGDLTPATEATKQQVEGILIMAGKAYSQHKLTSDQYWDIRDAAKEVLGTTELQVGQLEQAKTITGNWSEIIDDIPDVDINLDGAINDADVLTGKLNSMKNLTIPVNIEYRATGYTGGAFQTSGGGQLKPVYAAKSGQSG